MFKYFKHSLSFLIIVAVLIVPVFLIAQSNTPGGDGVDDASGGAEVEINDTPATAGSPSSQVIKFPRPFKGTGESLEDFVNLLIQDILMPIGGVVAVLMIMYAGFLYVTAGGKPDQIKKLVKPFSAVIGAAILLGAYVISSAIFKTLEALK